MPKVIKTLTTCWCLLIIAALILIDKKQNEDSNEITEVENEDISFYDLIKDRKFICLYIMNFSSVFYGYILIGQYKIFASKHIKDDMFLTLVGSIASIFGSLRFIWSLLLDCQFTYVNVYGTLCII